jgi:hypothetical protein
MKEWIYFVVIMLMLLTFGYCATLKADEPCDIYNYFQKTEYSDCAYIITKLAILESGWMKNAKHREFNNYFSVKDWQDERCKTKPIYCLKKFDSLADNLVYMLDYFRRKKYPVDKKGFIERLGKGYAEDPEHVEKIKKIKINCRR